MAKPNEDKSGEVPEKKESPIAFVGALIALALVAVGAGWFMVEQLQPRPSTPVVTTVVAPKDSDKKKEGTEETSDESGEEAIVETDVIILDPIIVALQKNDNTFLRIELAVIPEEGADVFGREVILRIGSDIAAFTKTLTLQQISGPTGFLHFREDILDRARLVTKGQVKDLLVIAMVAE